MTQEEFNQMFQAAIAGQTTGYFTTKYSWDEVEQMLDWVKQQMGS